MSSSSGRGGGPRRAKQRPSRTGANGTSALPDGWLRWWDEGSSQFYYQNTKTGEVTWSDPTRWRLGQWLERQPLWRGRSPTTERTRTGTTRGSSGSTRGRSATERTDEYDSSDSDEWRGPETIEQAFAEYCRGHHYRGVDEGSEDSESETEGSPRRTTKTKTSSSSSEVWLHVYDVKFRGAGVINALARPLTLGGAYHTGLEVHGREWSYGATSDECGIFCCAPKKCEPHKYRESISLGKTSLTRLAVFEALLKLAPLWWGTTYDLLRKNCNSFCIVLAGALGVEALPEWIHAFADGAAELDDRTRRLFVAIKGNPDDKARKLARQKAADDAVVEAAVVSDDYGKWRVDRYASYAAAKKRFDDLPLRHASVLFVKAGPRSHWTVRHTYGLPHGVANIQRKFLPRGRLDLGPDSCPAALGSVPKPRPRRRPNHHRGRLAVSLSDGGGDDDDEKKTEEPMTAAAFFRDEGPPMTAAAFFRSSDDARPDDYGDDDEEEDDTDDEGLEEVDARRPAPDLTSRLPPPRDAQDELPATSLRASLRPVVVPASSPDNGLDDDDDNNASDIDDRASGPGGETPAAGSRSAVSVNLLRPHRPSLAKTAALLQV